MKKITSIVFSFLLVFTLFVGAPITQVMASTGDSGSEIQQRTKQAEEERATKNFPVPYIFYDYGGFEGYLSLAYYFYADGLYHAIYRGTVYDGPPYPIPTTVYLSE